MLELVTDLLTVVVDRRDDDMAMIAAAIHGMQRPPADFTMITNNLIHDVPLGVVKQDCGLAHLVATPILKQWLW